METQQMHNVATSGAAGTPITLDFIISLLGTYNETNGSNQTAAIDNVILRLKLINEKEKRELGKKQG